MHQLDPATQPGTGWAGFHFDAAQIGIDLQRCSAIKTGPVEQMAIVWRHHQLDAGIAPRIQGQLADPAHLQSLVPDRCIQIQPGQILGLQHHLGAALGSAIGQGHLARRFARYIIEANGRAGEQAIRMLHTGRGEGDALPHQLALISNAISLLRVDQRRHHAPRVGQTNGVNAANLDPFIEDGHSLLDREITNQDIDALTTRRFRQPFVEGKHLPLLWLW